MSVTSPLKWHGGKHYLAERIIELMPRHLHFVETHGGSLAVLLARDPDRDWMGDQAITSTRGCSEVVNDLNGRLTNFWRVLQSPEDFAEFVRLVEATPFSQVEFDDSLPENPDPVNDAVGFFVRCRQSRAGCFKEFATLSRNRTRRGMNEQVSAWLTVVDGLPEVHGRLRRVVVLNQDAVKVIRSQDGPQTLFYCDPPYVHDTRATTGQYQHEMSNDQHRALLDALSAIQGKFILSGYASPLYLDAAKHHGWHRIDFDLANHAAGGDSKRRMTECLWMNYLPPGESAPANAGELF